MQKGVLLQYLAFKVQIIFDLGLFNLKAFNFILEAKGRGDGLGKGEVGDQLLQAAYTAKSPSLTFVHPPIICPKNRGPGKQGLHCFASCLAAAPLRGARCRPGSERVKAAGRDKGLGGGARFPHCLPQCFTGSLHLGVSGLAPGCPPTQSRGCSPRPAALGHLGPLNLQPSQAEGHPIPPPAPRLPARAPRFPCPPLRIGPHPGCPAPRRRQGQSLESGPPLPGDRGEAGASGPRRPARTHHATLPGPAHHRGAAPHSPAAGARPAGSRSVEAASSGPGRVPAGAQHGAAQRRPPRPREPSEPNAAPCWRLAG